ncbi:Hsp20/alpha crystallin family protein [Natronorubrum halalkaliphilum]|uniref:Hsp20/alpha crystallin family protein n=1 Tax=Natronorubrum halalkaliphilum TaxID=2691917 RepID=UPI003CCBAAEF
MTVDDSDPDDRRDESADDHDHDDESTDVPIDDSAADQDDDSRRSETPSDEGGANHSGSDSESTDRRSDDRGDTDSRISVSASGGDAGAGAGGGAGDADEQGQEQDEGQHWLSSLLSALESLESGSTSGRRRSDRTVLDYDISIGSGDGLADESRFERDPVGREGSDDRRRHAGSGSDRSRTRRRRSTPSNDHHLTTRATEDELLVTADVAGTDPDDVTVGFDGSTLVVAVSGSELERVDVPWGDRTARATIKNGVLTVQIEPSEGSTSTDEENDR